LKSEALRVKHEKKCPPAPKISDDVKYVNAWREPTMSTFKNHWHSTKRNTLKVPAKDMDNVNCTWQGWDHYDGKEAMPKFRFETIN
jgi:hypothetical protein